MLDIKQFRLDSDEVELQECFTRDVRAIGHYGTGDLEITLKNQGELERAQVHSAQ